MDVHTIWERVSGPCRKLQNKGHIKLCSHVPPRENFWPGQIMGYFSMHPMACGIEGKVIDLSGTLRGLYQNDEISIAKYAGDGTFLGFQELHPSIRILAYRGEIEHAFCLEAPIGHYSGCAEGAIAAFHCLELIRFCRDDGFGQCEVDTDAVRAYLREIRFNPTDAVDV